MTARHPGPWAVRRDSHGAWIVGRRDLSGEARGLRYTDEVRDTAINIADCAKEADARALTKVPALLDLAEAVARYLSMYVNVDDERNAGFASLVEKARAILSDNAHVAEPFRTILNDFRDLKGGWRMLTATVVEHKGWYESRSCKYPTHPVGKPVYRRYPYRWRATLACGATREHTDLAWAPRSRLRVMRGTDKHGLVYWRDEVSLSDLMTLIGRRAWDLAELNGGSVTEAEIIATVPAFEFRLRFCAGASKEES